MGTLTEDISHTRRKLNYGLLAAIIHTAITFGTDAFIFDRIDMGNPAYVLKVTDYFTGKLIVFAALLAFYSFIFRLIKNRQDKRISDDWRILHAGLCYLPVIAVVAALKLPQGFLTNDETAIFNNAITFTHDTWFNIMTTYYYIASLMIIPVKYGPIIVKMIIEFFVVGYTVFRFRRHFKNKWANLSYLLFCLYPVVAYTTSAHRLPVYFLLYLLMMCKFVFDAMENEPLSRGARLGMLFLGAVLTQWRTEGIYLAVLVPILMFTVYKELRNAKQLLVTIVLSLLLQVLLWIPQNGLFSDVDGAANDRMKPFYAYTITNMMRQGLDRSKNADDLDVVDRYLSIEAIDAINEHYGDINYEDVLILYQEGFVGVREGASVEDFVNYSDALKRIFVNNPDCFLRTRIGAFGYAAVPYHLISYEGGIKSVLMCIFAAAKSFLYNLFIPFGIIIVLLIVSLFKKHWVEFFICGGVLCHWFIVFILAPASYFKYYFPMYIMAYFFVILIVVRAISHLLNRRTRDIVQEDAS